MHTQPLHKPFETCDLSVLKDLPLEHLDIEGLWAPMKIRNEQLTLQWQQWLEGKAEQPTTPEPVQTHVSDMTEGELPDVADALAKLGDMGFLD